MELDSKIDDTIVKKMPVKILQFTNLINRYDFLDNIIEFGDRKRIETGVCICTAEGPIENPVFRDEMFLRVLNEKLTYSTIPQITWKLIKVIREWQPDILQTHHFHEAFIGFLAKKFCPRIKLIVGRHYSEFLYQLPSGVKTGALFKIEALSNNAAAMIMVPTHSIAKLLIERQNIDAGKVKVIPYGFDERKFTVPSDTEVNELRDELNLNGKFVVGNFSKLIPEKGLCYLIGAAAKLRLIIPNLLIFIAGEGHHKTALERQVSDLGLEDTIKFIGFRRDAMILMRTVDVIVQTSLQEAFGQVIVEAMWMKTPIVTTNVGIAPDIIETGVNGILIAKSDENSIVEAIKKLADDPFLGQKLADNGQKFVKDNLAMEKVIKTYENTYERIVSQKNQKSD